LEPLQEAATRFEERAGQKAETAPVPGPSVFTDRADPELWRRRRARKRRVKERRARAKRRHEAIYDRWAVLQGVRD
jgi:hypothetical protein